MKLPNSTSLNFFKSLIKMDSNESQNPTSRTSLNSDIKLNKHKKLQGGLKCQE